MNESAYKTQLIKEVNKVPGAYGIRHEDKHAVGRLDMFIKLPDRAPIWAEGKIIDGYAFQSSPRQHLEGEKIVAAGMLALLIGWKAGVMYVSPWVAKADARECFTLLNSKLPYLTTLERYLER